MEAVIALLCFVLGGILGALFRMIIGALVGVVVLLWILNYSFSTEELIEIFDK